MALTGGEKVTVWLPLLGVTELLATDVAPAPTLLLTVTVNV